MAAFLGHIAKESKGLENLEEGLAYKTLDRMKGKFKILRHMSDHDASAYLRKPEALANKVYAHRLGNRDVASGDGWRYRGRGLIHVTGKANYAAFAREAHVDVVKAPDLLATPRYAAVSAASFWKKHRLNELADAEMYQALSLRVNAQLDSFPEREANRRRALDALCLGLLGAVTSALTSGGLGQL
jgi:putative chitinase